MGTITSALHFYLSDKASAQVDSEKAPTYFYFRFRGKSKQRACRGQLSKDRIISNRRAEAHLGEWK